MQKFRMKFTMHKIWNNQNKMALISVHASAIMSLPASNRCANANPISNP